MTNLNNFIYEKLKITNNTKIRNNKYSESVYTLNEIVKIINKSEESFGAHKIHGDEIAYRYLNKYFDKNSEFYFSRVYEFKKYNEKLYDEIIGHNYFLKDTDSLEKNKWYDVDSNFFEDITVHIIEKNDNKIFWVGLLDKNDYDFYLKYIIIEKETFKKL